MTETIDTTAADRALKAKHRAIWASGSYETIVNEVDRRLGPILVDAAGVGPTDRVLDVAAGTGNAAIPAAEIGAQVVASDLTPELFEIGRASGRGARSQPGPGRTADAEALPFGDDEFDAVLSCIGVMFAPHHQAAADELIRVCRPGGTIGADQLDTDGLHRRAVRRHEAVRAAAPAGRAAAAAVGQRGTRPRAVR